jgi:hypothetical protein
MQTALTNVMRMTAMSLSDALKCFAVMSFFDVVDAFALAVVRLIEPARDRAVAILVAALSARLALRGFHALGGLL